jgi:HEAT repeats
MRENGTSTNPMLTTVVRLTILISTVLAPGCGREQRGPILLGGREVKSWVADLHHPKPQVRRQAVLKLGNVGDSEPAIAEGLAQALNDSDALVRRDAVVAVTRLKEPSAAIWERLETMSRSDKDARTRELAHKAITRRLGTE